MRYLKTTDLMVGNHVSARTKYLDCDNKVKEYKQEVRKVDPYLLESLMKQEDGIVKEDVLGYLYIEPIPITDKILEKSEFVMGRNDEFVFSDDYYDVEMKEITDSVWRLRVTHTEMSFNSYECTVCSVHEFEQGLKLFGAELEVKP